MSPSVSIVIPVYNAAAYLAECLDSVLAQTLREIQVICIDDGSTDTSTEILDTYRQRDARLTVLTQPNGGQGRARNAALPHLEGKYTYFVDADDWLDRAACEKMVAKADATDAEMLYLLAHMPGREKQELRVGQIVTEIYATPAEKKMFTHWSANWLKLWKTSFLREKNIRYEESFPFEDIPQNWLGLVSASRIAFLPEKLYYYRATPGSTMDISTRKQEIVDTMTAIEARLRKEGYFEAFGPMFLNYKLWCYKTFHRMIPVTQRPDFERRIIASLGEDDERYLAGRNELPWYVRDFYQALAGSRIARLKDRINDALRHWYQR